MEIQLILHGMTVHPKNARLHAGLRRLLMFARPWNGAIFRNTSVAYANRADLLSGVGSRQHGGRWNPPGRFNCVYGSLDPHTALEEAFAASDRYGIPRSKARPRVQVAIVLELQLVLDLTPNASLRALGTSKSELKLVDWEMEQEGGNEALTQAIGRLAWEEKLEGLIVPSSRVHHGKNLVLFPGRRRRGSSWKIQGGRDLPGKA